MSVRLQGHTLLLSPVPLRIGHGLIATLLVTTIALQYSMAQWPAPVAFTTLLIDAEQGQELIVQGLHMDGLMLTHDQAPNEIATAYFENGRLDPETLQNLQGIKPPAGECEISWLAEESQVTPQHPLPVNTTITVRPFNPPDQRAAGKAELHFFQSHERKVQDGFGDIPYFEMEALGTDLHVTLEVNAPVSDDDAPGLFRRLIMSRRDNGGFTPVLNRGQIDGQANPIGVIVPSGTSLRFYFRPARPNSTLWDSQHSFTPFRLTQQGNTADALRVDRVGVKRLEESHQTTTSFLQSVGAVAGPAGAQDPLSVTKFKVGKDEFEARIKGEGTEAPDPRPLQDRFAAGFETHSRLWLVSLAVEALLLLCLRFLGPLPVFLPPPDGGFDVFLCHNSADKPTVRKIAKQLEQAGIRTWLDEEELRPGLPYQAALEKQIASCRSVAIFIGKRGMGPWQQLEQEAFIRQFIKRQCPVIPVILPNCKGEPQLPLFLEGMMWVDFRNHQHDPIEELIFGITGKRPEPNRTE
jgi:hypothetical protein